MSIRVPTPKQPTLVAIGDSFTSGHHRDNGIATTICHDNQYGYPSFVWQNMESLLPPQWQNPNGYLNVAESGFSTGQILDGGKDACGTSYPSEIKPADALKAAAGSWNRVVITAGIDDTNWVPRISNLLHDTFNWDIGHITTISSGRCANDLSGWDLKQNAAGLRSDVRKIATDLRTSDPASRIAWIDYYNIAGTGGPFDLKSYAFLRVVVQSWLKIWRLWKRPSKRA